MTTKTKTCSECHETKSLDEFYKQKKGKYGKKTHCKDCDKKQSRKYRQTHKKEIKEKSIKDWEEHREYKLKQKRKYYENGGREKQGSKSMYEDKSSAQWLGIVIGERLCRHLFKDVEVMPYGFPGYDFICNKGMKINIKTACVTFSNGKYPSWSFTIDHNTVADYFICVAFDNRTDLNPLHIWMIPGKDVNHKKTHAIRTTTIHKWDVWKRDINDAQLCCNKIKGKPI